MVRAWSYGCEDLIIMRRRESEPQSRMLLESFTLSLPRDAMMTL